LSGESSPRLDVSEAADDHPSKTAHRDDIGLPRVASVVSAYRTARQKHVRRQLAPAQIGIIAGYDGHIALVR
jgi:hypothetical protein